MSDRITRDDVVHVARLARLALSDAEIDEFTAQLGDILTHAADIESFDVGDVEPRSRPLPMVNVLRPDQPRPVPGSAPRHGRATAAEAGQFRVPPILGEQP